MSRRWHGEKMGRKALAIIPAKEDGAMMRTGSILDVFQRRSRDDGVLRAVWGRVLHLRELEQGCRGRCFPAWGLRTWRHLCALSKRDPFLSANTPLYRAWHS